VKTFPLVNLRFTSTILLYLIVLVFGYLFALQQHRRQIHSNKNQIPSSDSNILVIVRDQPERKPRSVKLLVQSEQYPQVMAFLYLKKSEKAFRIHDHDLLLVRNTFKKIKHSNNPGSFNYANYCAKQHIYQSGFLEDKDYVVFDSLSRNKLYVTTYTSQWIHKTLQRYIPGESESGFALALLLGYRKGLDEELYQAYANTGLMHLIAISGMHIGLLYLSVLQILKWVNRKQKTTRWQVVIALEFIWFFAFMVGLSPSVYRAAFMMTLLGGSELIQRKIHPVNTLSASAFLLLIQNPDWLFDAGFQLSYLAVLGIYTCYRSINSWFYFKSSIVTQLWQIVSATLAAQVFTLPLSLYYFHQFPLLFIVTNVVGVMATTLFLYAEILLLFVSGIPVLAIHLGKALSWGIQKLNQFVSMINAIDGQLLDGIRLNVMQTLLLLLLFSVLVYILHYRKMVAGIFGVGSLLFLFQVSLLASRYTSASQRRLVFFQLARTSAVGFVHGNRYHYLMADSLRKNFKLERYTFRPFQTYYQLKVLDSSIMHRKQMGSSELIAFEGKIILITPEERLLNFTSTHLDYVVFSGKKGRMEFLGTAWPASITLVVDGTLPWKLATTLGQKARQMGIKTHVIQENGALVHDF
jgi:competence protein ComEC